jgi:hypothetical protein
VLLLLQRNQPKTDRQREREGERERESLSVLSPMPEGAGEMDITKARVSAELHGAGEVHDDPSLEKRGTHLLPAGSVAEVNDDPSQSFHGSTAGPR